MHYLSLIWLAWMWLTVSAYWLAPRKSRLVVLMLITLAFLAIHAPESAIILVLFALVTYAVESRPVVSIPMVAGASVFFLAVLFTFKIGQAFDSLRLLETVILPLGLSYYTFRCVHVLLERVKGHLPPMNLHDLAGYLFFLPTIVVGPIHRADEFRRDLARQRFDPGLLSEGAERILYGYVKIVILSNALTEGVFGSYIAELPNQEGAYVLYLKTVQAGLNLYFQFSGFSDIAIGFARLLGFRVMENFHWPYFQSNISAFWRSWHMSLSRWCRDYVYGVVVSFTRSPALGALCTMIVIGLWHEVSLRFVLWGAYHACGIILWQMTASWGAALTQAVPRSLGPSVHALKILVTVHFVWFGFVILTAETPMAALGIYETILFSWL